MIFNLPHEIVLEILSFTSPTTAAQFSRVNKQGYKIASDVVLWRMFCKRVLKENEYDKEKSKIAYKENLTIQRFFASSNKKLHEKIIEILEVNFDALNGEYISKKCTELMAELPFSTRMDRSSPFVEGKLDPYERKSKQIISTANPKRFNTPIEEEEVRNWHKSVIEKNNEKLLPYLADRENRLQFAKKLKNFKQKFSV